MNRRRQRQRDRRRQAGGGEGSARVPRDPLALPEGMVVVATTAEEGEAMIDLTEFPGSVILPILADVFGPKQVEELEAYVEERIAAALNDHYEQRRWLTVKQAAEHLGLSESGVRRQIERGRLPVKRLGRRLLIDRQQLDRRLERLD